MKKCAIILGSMLFCLSCSHIFKDNKEITKSQVDDDRFYSWIEPIENGKFDTITVQGCLISNILISVDSFNIEYSNNYNHYGQSLFDTTLQLKCNTDSTIVDTTKINYEDKRLTNKLPYNTPIIDSLSLQEFLDTIYYKDCSNLDLPNVTGNKLDAEGLPDGFEIVSMSLQSTGCIIHLDSILRKSVLIDSNSRHYENVNGCFSLKSGISSCIDGAMGNEIFKVPKVPMTYKSRLLIRTISNEASNMNIEWKLTLTDYYGRKNCIKMKSVLIRKE